ncbi:hypothetical protein IBA8402_15810 [Pseudomonas syringae]
MNTRGLLDQLLKSGQSMLQDKNKGKSGKQSSGSDSLINGLGSLLGGGKGQGGSQNGLGGLLSGAGGGALAAGAMSLLRGKRTRGMGGKVLTYGAWRRWEYWLTRHTTTGSPARGLPLNVNRKPSTGCPRLKPSSTARQSCAHWSPPQRPMAMSMSVSAN